MKKLAAIILLIISLAWSITPVFAEDNLLQGIELNDGNKWDMDQHTRSSFNQMAEYFLPIDLKLATIEDLKKTGVHLQSQSDSLIQGCTMTGDAHDQLHEFLMHYLPAVNNLAQFGKIEDADNIKYLLSNYNKYFK